MKHITTLLAAFLLTLSPFAHASILHSPLYCATSSWGYAGTAVTGGGNATPTLVKSETELKNALKSSNQVIIITQDIEITHRISVYVNNLTLMALPGVTITSNQRNKDDSGIFIFKSNIVDGDTLYSNNIILRNLTLKGPGAYDCNGYDLLSLEGATNIWVDHCDFQDGMDGNFDMKNNSDDITVTWCRFRYLIDPIPAGEGGDSDDHRFSNLIGSSSSNKPNDGTFNVTYAYCWWDEGCKQRMTRCRNAELHFLNCYWNSSVADYYVGPENASCYFEGCTFDGNANTASQIFSEAFGSENACLFVNCAGNLPDNQGTVAAPEYTYDHLTAATALTYTTNSSCGAGATLTVTTDGNVSSSCDEEEEEEDTTPVSENTFWNISDDDFKALGDISAEKVVRKLHIVATSDAKITIDASPKTVDNIQFTHRLKFGGTGSESTRHLKFRVPGNCEITVYLTSSSGSGDARTLNIATGSFSNVISTMTAPAGTVNKETYTYTGEETTVYLYSANSGINIYGVKVTFSDAPSTGIELPEDDVRTTKVLRNGQLYLKYEGQMYNVQGQQIQ